MTKEESKRIYDNLAQTEIRRCPMCNENMYKSKDKRAWCCLSCGHSQL